MILSQNIYMYAYGSWVVISIVLFDISKNNPFLVPFIVHLENLNSEHRKMRAKQQHVCKEMNQYTGSGF